MPVILKIVFAHKQRGNVQLMSQPIFDCSLDTDCGKIAFATQIPMTYVKCGQGHFLSNVYWWTKVVEIVTSNAVHLSVIVYQSYCKGAIKHHFHLYKVLYQRNST